MERKIDAQNFVRPDSENDPGKQVSTVLRSITSELDVLASLSDRLQILISDALVADGASNAQHIKEFQAIDLLVQRLHGVAIFVDALSWKACPEWRIDVMSAAAQVPLSDLANRLCGQIDDGRPARRLGDDADATDFELFA